MAYRAVLGRLFLLRHGQSTWNAARRWQGWADPPLSELGEAQARQAAGRLRGEALTLVVTSDLARARRTGEIVAASLGLPVETEPALRERDAGAWSGLRPEEIEARWPGAIDAFRRGELSRIPGGEGDILPRVLPALVRLATRGRGALVAVTHGGVIASVELALGGAATRPGNLGGRWLSWRNDALHLEEAVALAPPDAGGDEER